MVKKQTKWWQSKTIWTGVGAMLTALGGYLTGEMSGQAAVQTAFTGLTGIFLRMGMLK